MRNQRALIIAIAAALGALTAGAAAHPAAVRAIAERARVGASNVAESAISRVAKERPDFLVSGDVRAVSAAGSELRLRAQRPLSPVTEIDLPHMTIRSASNRVATATVAENQAPCPPAWRTLVSGPEGRRVRALCPSELATNAVVEPPKAEHVSAGASDEPQRLEVPHAFSNDHLIDPKAPLP